MNSLLSGIAIFVIVVLVLLIVFFGGALLLSGKAKLGKKGSNEEQKQKSSNPFLQKTLSWFWNLSWRWLIIVSLIAFGAWHFGNRYLDVVEHRPRTTRAPLVPTEFVLDPGDSSPVFQLNPHRFDRDPHWNAHVSNQRLGGSACPILPYVFRVNERTENGTTHFDGYQVINTSNQPLMFYTWQSPRREGEPTAMCD